jgi:integrase
VKDEIILKNPLDKFQDRPDYKNPKRDFLTLDQVNNIEKFALHGATPEQRFSAIWFLIGCYTGFRISDMKTFEKKRDIVGHRIIKENIKTREIVSLPLAGKIKELLELVQYKPLNITNEAYNRMLKVIMEKCDIPFNLIAHSSRHTAAMLLANSGASLDEIAAILGHVNTKHTRIYARMSNQRIDSAMSKIINVPKPTSDLKKPK